jgi:hypothetical protein
MSESSFDGSIGTSVNYATWESTSSPGEYVPLSPIMTAKHQEFSVPINFDENQTNEDECTAKGTAHSTSPDKGPLLLKSCFYLSEYLQERGFAINDLMESDVDPVNE